MKSVVLKQAVRQGLLCPETTEGDLTSNTPLKSPTHSQIVNTALHKVEEEKACAFFYDLDAYEQSLKDLKEGFAPHFLHAAAVKANPIEWFMKYRDAQGLGAECASFGEVKLALDVGVKPERIVFDSPCKTVAEIEASLELGIHLNIDNLQELERVKQVVNNRAAAGQDTKSSIGLRINPLLGLGKVAALSVSTGKSKFGCPLPWIDKKIGGGEPKADSAGDHDQEIYDRLLQCCVEHAFINCIHVHSGSGGMGIKKLCMGVKAVVSFAKTVNARRQTQGLSTKIEIIDIGGGIAVTYEDREAASGTQQGQQPNLFAEYAAELKRITPELFDPTIFKQVITEFGASLNCNYGWFVSRVEYTKKYNDHNIALIHGGSDVFVRACYCPGKFVQYRIEAFSAEGELKGKGVSMPDLSETETSTGIKYDIAGPLCFAGDIVCKNVCFQTNEGEKGGAGGSFGINQGDLLVVCDCGGNSVSIKNMHCSRPIPAVYGYRKQATGQNDGDLAFVKLKAAQSLDNLVSFWK